jgi:hypothetical protein
MKSFIITTVFLVVLAFGAFLLWRGRQTEVAVPPPDAKPLLQLTISNYGTLLRVSDAQGKDLSPGTPLIDGYTIIYEKEEPPGSGNWQRKAFNAVGDQVVSAGQVTWEFPPDKNKDEKINPVVIVSTPDLRIVNSYWQRNGTRQVHVSRAVDAIVAKGVRGISLVTYHQAKFWRNNLNLFLPQKWVLDKTCWPCEEQPCEGLTGPSGQERIICLTCPSENRPALFPAQTGNGSRSEIEALIRSPQIAEVCQWPGIGTFPYNLPAEDRPLPERGLGFEGKTQYLLACAKCPKPLPEYPGDPLRRRRAFDVHEWNSVTSPDFTRWLRALERDSGCLTAIRSSFFDSSAGRPEVGEFPFVVIERREWASIETP